MLVLKYFQSTAARLWYRERATCGCVGCRLTIVINNADELVTIDTLNKDCHARQTWVPENVKISVRSRAPIE